MDVVSEILELSLIQLICIQIYGMICFLVE